MEKYWTEYQCKSGQTLFKYNKETGEHMWPLGLPEGIEYKVIFSRPAEQKQVSTTATQTDDNGCSNGCLSKYINTDTGNVSSRSHAVLPQQHPGISKDENTLIYEVQTVKLDLRDEQEEGQNSEMLTANQNNLAENSNCGNDDDNGDSDNTLREAGCQGGSQNLYYITEILQDFDERKCSTEYKIIANRTDKTGDNNGPHGVLVKSRNEESVHSRNGCHSDVGSKNNICPNTDHDADNGFESNMKIEASNYDETMKNEAGDDIDTVRDTLRVVYKQDEDIEVIGVLDEKQFLPRTVSDKRLNIVQHAANQDATTLCERKQLNKKKSLFGHHQCAVCKKVFKLKGSLHRHSVLHTQDRYFQCTFCKKKFSQKGHMTTHLRTHTGEKPFECSYCMKRFNDKSSFTKHTRLHDRKKTF